MLNTLLRGAIALALLFGAASSQAADPPDVKVDILDAKSAPILRFGNDCYMRAMGSSASNCDANIEGARVGFNVGLTGGVDLNGRDALRALRMSPEWWGATNSTSTLSCTVTAGSTTMTCASAGDFKKGQQVRINKAGAAVSVGSPTALTLSQGGTAGSTSYTYSIRPIESNGAVGAKIADVTTTTGNATLSNTNWNGLVWSAPAGTAPVGYAVCGGSAGTDLLKVVTGLSARDTGASESVVSDWLPACTSSSAQNAYFVTFITNVSGTTFTLADAPTTSATGTVVSHENEYAINQTIANCPTLRCVIDVGGPYLISSRINLNIVARFSGEGMGGTGGAANPLSKSRLVWAGPPGTPMMRWGLPGSTQNVKGGELSYVTLDGRGMASYGLWVENLELARSEGVRILGTHVAGMYLTNDPAAVAQSKFNSFKDLNIDIRARLNSSADGIRVDGHTGALGNPAVTLYRFDNLVITHMNGHGVRWMSGAGNGGGDGFTFIAPWIYRGGDSTGESGYAMFNDADDMDMVSSNHHIFYGILTGGICVTSPAHGQNIVLYGFDTMNVSGVATTGSKPIMCDGRHVVSGRSVNGRTFGADRLPGGNSDFSKDDGMAFIAYSGGVLQTAQGNWLGVTTANPTTAAVGKGIDIITGATSGNSSMIYYPSTAADGPALSDRPVAVFSVSHPSNAAITTRWGFMNSTAYPSSSGAWFEFTTTTPSYGASTKYRCVTAVGGNYTAVDTPYAPVGSGADMKFKIEGADDVVNYYISPGNASTTGNHPDLWTHVCTIKTTLPTAGMFVGAQVITNTTAAKLLRIQHMKEAHKIGLF